MSTGKAPDQREKSSDALVEPDVLRLFAGLAAYHHLALAVSGGADSTALMLLVAKWLTQMPDFRPQITVLTVDHGLRKEAANEARKVVALSEKLNFSHHTLVWSGRKPKAGLQAAARKARYDLLTEFCHAHQIPALVTGHQGDDQAETVFMRLARGSGVDGLSAMAPLRKRNGIDLLRPLLPVSRDQLTAFLEAEGQDWIEDPSNQDLHYERIKVRKVLADGSAPGLTTASLALSAQRLRRSRNALEAVAADFLRSALTVNEAGFGTLSAASLMDQPEDIALRAVIRMANAFGGRRSQVRLSKAEAALAMLRNGSPGLTLGGCSFKVRRGHLLSMREFGRMPRQPIAVSSRQSFEWDGRFEIAIPDDVPENLTIRPLGPDGIKAFKQLGGDAGGVPRPALLALPSFWQSAALVNIPVSGLFNAEQDFVGKAVFAKRDELFAR